MTRQPTPQPAARTDRAATTWSELEARIEEVGRSLAAEATVSPEQTRLILARRARALAVPLSGEDDQPCVELLGVERDGRHFALETRFIAAIVRNPPTAPLPGAEPPVSAVASWRGRLLTTLDLGSSGEIFRAPFLIVLGAERAEIGLIGDIVGEITSVPLDRLRDVPDGPMRWRQYMKALTDDTVPLIDGDLLLRRHAIDR